MKNRRFVMKSVVGSLLAVTLMSQASFSFADTLDTIKQRKKILVAVDIGAPPFGMLDGAARQSGSDIEAAQLLAKDLGVELEVVPVSGPNRVPFLLTKKADIVMASFSITDERKKVVDFSVPFAVLQVVVGGPSKQKIASFADLGGKTIAVTRGTTSDQELTKGVKDVAGVTVVRYEDDATTNTAVATGQQDYIAAAMSVLPQVKKANASRDVEPKFSMKGFPLGIGMRKNEPELKAYLDGWVRTNVQNGKLNEIYKKYFGVALPADMLN